MCWLAAIYLHHYGVVTALQKLTIRRVFIFAVCETTGTWQNSFVPYAAKKTHSERVPSVLLPVKLSSGKVSNGGIYPSGFKFLK